MDFMVDAFLCLVLDVFWACQSKVPPLGMDFPLRGCHLQGPDHNALAISIHAS
jgi:hypothetical protein